MKLFEIIFVDRPSIIEFANTRRELRIKYADYRIREINRVEIH